MMSFILIILFSLTVMCDTKQSGGASCQTNEDCGGINGGQCENVGNQSYCVCLESRGDPDCSYQRIRKNLAGGLQFLCLIGISGVGEYLLGNFAVATGQLILMIVGYVAVCILIPCMFCIKGGPRVTSHLSGCLCCLTLITILAGWIWSIVDGIHILRRQVTDYNGYYPY
jgi:hypothetical protein